MINDLKEILKISRKAHSFLCLFYIVEICLVGLLILGSSLNNMILIYVSIAFVVLAIISQICMSFVFLKKVKQAIVKVDFLKDEYKKLYQKTYYVCFLYFWNRIIKLTNNAIATLTDETLIEQIKTENKQIVFETERLYIRNLKDSDLDFIYQYRNNEKVNFYQVYDAFSHEEIKNLIKINKNATLFQDQALFAIEKKESNEMIGELYISYKPFEKSYFIGFTIDLPFQRNGYAYEAVNELIVQVLSVKSDFKLVCTVYQENISSLNLIKKLEFKKVNQFMGEKGKIFVFEKEFK